MPGRRLLPWVEFRVPCLACRQHSLAPANGLCAFVVERSMPQVNSPESARGSHVHSPQVIPTPRPCSWGHMSSLQGDSSSPDLVPEVSVHSFQGQHTLHTIHLWSHLHSLHGDPPPLLYLDYITTVYRVKHLSGPCTWNHTSRISRVNHFQNLHLG